MKRIKAILSIILAVMMVLSIVPVAAFAVEADAEVETRDLVQYVDPLIGSNNFKGNSEFAGLAPFVTAPFGMTNFTPQTRENRIGDISYMSQDTKITGFFASHQPAIWMGDYGYFNVMPQAGETIKPDKNDRGLSFTHGDEISKPYYYSVTMDKENSAIQGEMTATERCAIYRFTFPKGGKNSILIESARGRGDSSITVDAENNEIRGWNNDNMSSHLNNNPPKNLKGYFSVQFNKPIEAEGTYKNYQVTAGSDSANGQKAGAYVTFDTEPGEVIELLVGTSFLSEEQAKANVAQEIGDKSFETVSDDLEKVWNDTLNTIQIDGATYDENCIFYTAMFHASMYPRKFYEVVDGTDTYFSPYDDKVHEGKSYTDFSLWDTFRAENSFLTLVHPELTDEMVTSLLQNYQEGGYMPKWPNPGYSNIMIGTHADSVVAEAIQKGLLDKSKYELAYEAVFKDAMYQQDGDGSIMWGDRQTNVPYEARGGLGSYKKLGYVANGYANENVSRTLEFSYDDWCVAQVAKATGRETEYEFFLNRSLNYKNAISPDTGYAMGRDREGNWGGGAFTEGSDKKYTWFALHDPQGLINYMTEHKGESFFNTELEKAWTQGWLEQQNEPCHHYAYMFNFSGRPDLTQKYARETLKSYSNDHSGMLGNDDCGQMSSWYIFSAMGFYPVNPASGEYMIGSPIFDKVTINNPLTKKQFVLTADNNNDAENKNTYIQSATLNGKAHNIPVLTHQQITEGGTMNFVMGDTASTWGSQYKKDAIVGNPDVTIEDPKPAFMGNSSVKRYFGGVQNIARISSLDVPGNYVSGNDIGDPAITLIDGKLNMGYKSSGISQADLDANPFYMTFTWDQAQDIEKMIFAINYPKSQGITTINIETTTDGEQWNRVVTDYTFPWKTDGEQAEEQTVVLPEVQRGVIGLRVQVKKGEFKWGGFCAREIEIYGPAPSEEIDKAHLTDVMFEVNYNTNKLTGMVLDGRTLEKDVDYTVGGDKDKIITVKKEVFQNCPINAKTPIVFTFDAGDPVELLLNVTEDGSVSAWFDPVNIGRQVSQATAPKGWMENNDSGAPITMFDGRLNMGYASVENPTYPHNIDASWETAQSFNKVAIFSNYAHEQAPTDVSILVSEDGVSNWTPVVENVQLSWQPNGNDALPGNVIELPERVTNVKGMRIQINKAIAKWGRICIREIEVYDDEETRVVKQNPLDLSINVEMNNTELASVDVDGSVLTADTDYTYAGKKVVLKADYLQTLEAGERTVTLTFANDKTIDLAFTVVDLSEEPSNIVTDKDTYQVNETITVTIRTDSKVGGIRLRNENGLCLGLTKVKSVYQDGEKIWTIQTSVGTAGDRTLQVIGYQDGQWNELGDFSMSVKAAPKAAVYKAEIQEEQAAVNQRFTVQVYTSQDAEDVVVCGETGRYISSRVESYEDQGDERVFTISMEVGSAGNRTFSFYAVNGEKKLSEQSAKASIVITK